MKEKYPEFFSRDGVSLVLINTQQGKSLFKNIQTKIESIKSSVENAAKFNGILNLPAKRPAIKKFIYSSVNEHFFEIPILTKLKGLGLDRIRIKIKNVLNQLEA